MPRHTSAFAPPVPISANMMIHRKRFALALERLEPSDWARFEAFASSFLAEEFPEIRTTATTSGDGGRDAELFSPNGEPEIVIQYSVTKKFLPKIRATAKAIKKNFPAAQQLIYVTNQLVGAKSDDVKKELRLDQRISLDVRDCNYFLDRFEGGSRLEKIAESLAKEIVDPYLEGKDVIEKKARALSTGESRAALVFLEMQWEDDSRDKGLTRMAFDALTRTALRSTNSEKRMKRHAVREAVVGLLPGRDAASVRNETEKALTRLSKKSVRHYTADDSFCLAHEELERIKDRLAENEIIDVKLNAEISHVALSFLSEAERRTQGLQEKLADVSRIALEKYLLLRGELFVAALENGQLDSLGFDPINNIVASLDKGPTKLLPAVSSKIRSVIQDLLEDPPPALRSYLRSVADAYTLLAFLRETPDVQAAAKKMFSVGEIWLDTTIVLPLLAEDLLDDEKLQFRRLIRAAHAGGLKLKVSPGVMEEVESHVHRSEKCASDSSHWIGNIPYLFASYISAGRGSSEFSKWLKKFKGDARPIDDLADFLRAEFDINVSEISDDARRCEPNLRDAIKEAWVAIHEDRRNRPGKEIDPILALRLAEHDTENYAGVLVRRRQENASAFGFTSWWLTLDHMAFGIHRKLVSYIAGKVPPSPVMSADFLSNYLAFGPLRSKVLISPGMSLPVAMDASLMEITPELLKIANRVRDDAKDLDEHVVQRMVRDALDSAKRRTGELTQRGLRGV